MEFEWDEAKRHANLAKHGIDFDRARHIWEKGMVLDPYGENWVHGEHRCCAVGAIDDSEGEKVIAVVYTVREDRVRIISARSARKNEREDYHKAIGRSAPR
jgi:uncharacterized DUF497 family protein